MQNVMQALYLFLLTPLREGRPGRMAWSARHRDFYSRPCGRGDQELLNSYQNSIISTHAPAGGATDLVGHRFGVAQFLLTPLREGRRRRADPAGIADQISTHAPAGGATHAVGGLTAALLISTHAPAGGATEPITFPMPSNTISTHAPAGGAT